MPATTILAMILVGGGLALLAVGLLARVLRREDQLIDLLNLPYGEGDLPVVEALDQYGTLVSGTIGMADRIVDQVDTAGGLALLLERAQVTLRPGELVLLSGAAGITAAAVGMFLSGWWPMGLLVLLATPFVTKAVLGWRIRRRSKKFAEQFPDALQLVASSLTVGHTFLRSLQMMQAECDSPLSDEFGRVVSETQLGAPLVDALERMGRRLELRDVDWVVQAIRIQQELGGKLAELLTTLAEFIRAREEIRREIDVLTAEGRISAWVLGALPVFLFFAVQVMNPGYMDPMFHGWGPVWLGLTGGAMGIGLAVILRMVKGVEV